MELKLIAIKYHDYRNIKPEQILLLENITSLVGPNESGKSNLLDSILYLRPENKMLPMDVTIGSSKSLDNKLPSLDFYLQPQPESGVQSSLKKYIKRLDQSFLTVLTREGDEITLGFANSTFQPEKVQFSTVWTNISDSPMQFTLRDKETVTLQPNEEIVGDANNGLSLARLKKKNLINETEEQVLIDKLKKIILDNLPKVTRWKYQEESYYIKDEVPWTEFLDEPGKYRANERLFELAVEKYPPAREYRDKLKSFSSDTRKVADYLEEVSRALSDVIKDIWKQSNIRIDLENREGKLEVSIRSGGQRIPPSIRSEGLKWFISFLLEFRSQGNLLVDNIFLFDQPGDTLHPGGQKELIQRFDDISDNNQIVYASQSPFMVNRNYWERIRFLKPEDGISEVGQPTNINIRNDELLRTVLGYTLADVGQANEWNVVTEGYWDKIIFRWHARRINKEEKTTVFDFNKISIFDAESGRSVRTRVDELVQARLNAIGVFDADREDNIKKARENKELKERYISIKEIAGDSFITGEDFVPGNIYLKGIEKLINRKITATRTANNLVKHPRLKRLNNYLRKIKQGSLTKDGKETMWLLIEDELEKYDSNNLDQPSRAVAEKLIKNFLSKLDDLK